MSRQEAEATRQSARLPLELFSQVVRLAPLISFDLVLRDAQGRVLLGRRLNAPARGFWFVPGGCVRKGEILSAALARISATEIGKPLRLEEVTFLGVYEHHYQDNAMGAIDFGTHYIVLGCEAQLDAGEARIDPAQHGAHRFFSEEDLLADPDVHPNTKAYFLPRPAGSLEGPERSRAADAEGAP